MEYLLCLDKQYIVKLGDSTAIFNLETMLDNMINLLKEYGIEDSEILENLQEDTLIKIEEEQE